MSNISAIFIDEDLNNTEFLPTNTFFEEKWLQNLLIKHPKLLPTSEIDDTFAPLFFVADEISVSCTDRLDNLYITPSGHLVIVETKLWRNPEAVRTVVAQAQDYAKSMQYWSYERINKIFQKRERTDIFSAMKKAGLLSSNITEHEFIDKVTKNLKQANFLLLIVGDGIREGLPELVDFINNPINGGYHIALCQIQVFEQSGKRIAIPRLIAKTVELGVFRIKDKISFEPTIKHKKVTATEPMEWDSFVRNFTKNNPEVSDLDLTSFINKIISQSEQGFKVKHNSQGVSIVINDITVVRISTKDIRIDARKINTHRGLASATKTLLKDLQPVIIHRTKTQDNQLSIVQLSAAVLSEHKKLFLDSLTTFSSKSNTVSATE